MTKHLRILFVMLMGLLGVTTGWAQQTQTLTEGFETKAATTTYNSTVTVAENESDCGIGWEIYYGTVSTNDKISGDQSCQMRYYASANTNYGYVKNTTPVDNLTKVSFKARTSSKDMKFDVLYSADNSTWANIATDESFTTTGQSGIRDLEYNIPAGGKYIQIKVSSSSTVSSGNIKLIIDNITFTTSGSSATVAKPTFSVASGTYTSAQSVEISCATEGASIYYTTDGTDPDNQSTQYLSAITVDEDMTIKAIAYSGSDASSIATAEYTFISLDHAGTEADPYSVADAIKVIDNNLTTTDVYVKGTVSTAPTSLNSGALTYFISDDGTTESYQLQAYKGYGINGDEFTSVNDIWLGDVVVVYGDLTKYNSIYEFAEGNVLISITEAPSHTATFSVNGTTTTASLKKGAAITFPEDPADIEGKSFVGWTDSAINGTTNVKPDFVTSAIMGDDDVTFYAVFANVEGNQETATLTASHTANSTTYADHTYTDDKGNTWTAYNNEPYENNVARFGLNKTASPARQFTSPEFSGNITSIVIMPYNGSSTATRSFYINSEIGEKGDLGTIDVSPGIKLTEELTATLDDTEFNQFYLQVSDALGFSYIKVTYGDMSCSDYCTTVEAAATSESITISTARYATYITTNALDFTDTDVTAFIVDDATTANVHFKEVKKVPAATPIVVKAAAAGTYDIPVTTDDTENVGTNLLLAPVAGQTSTGVEYCLANKTKGVGFYPVLEGVAIKKAYLIIRTTSAPEFIGFIEDGGISTGISTVAVENAELNIDAPMYNIAGQRVSRSYKGVVIQNGKKFVVK